MRIIRSVEAKRTKENAMNHPIVFCITQRLTAGRQTYQAGVTLPMWSYTKVKQIGPVCATFDEAQQHINKVRPRRIN